MSKPVLILAPDWRRMDELFSPAAYTALTEVFDVIWARDDPIPEDIYMAALPDAEVIITAEPAVTRSTLAQAPNLRAVIEVSGAFPASIDYAACFEAGIEVLSCAPGFRQSVAEMGLAMALAGARGLVNEHEAFRVGTENWLSDNTKTDFTLYGSDVGFIGFGQIAQELTRLLSPFRPAIKAFDPWLPEDVAHTHGITLTNLDDLLRHSRCLFVTAVPTAENRGLLDAARLTRLPDHALLVLLSRAHLVDFDALTAEVASGRLRAGLDVFPTEPVPQSATLRSIPNVILSPHRAAAVDKGRHLIGDMIVADLQNLHAGEATRNLSRANPQSISLLAGVGDAEIVGQMAAKRSL